MEPAPHPADPDEGEWQRADALFDQALDLVPGERGAFLAEACGPDALLKARVERLLVHASALEDGGEKPDEALTGPFAQALAEELESDHQERDSLSPGTVIGRYVLGEEIGRGGMAVVYAAQRADGVFEQQVALKVIKRGLDSDELAARFRQERQILARLEHPAIARLIDGGTTPDGRPYFVLEAVAGLPIDRYADEQGLDRKARLELLLEVARAVEHAHRHLVVHRDLKPSNILVTAAGEVKLLDFGIAKLLDPTAESTLTHAAVRVLTPAYASPEQLRGDAITTASDVYQLGLLLRLLLTGEAPARSGDAAPPWARLPRDLGQIITKALAEEPSRRYGSVALLAEDLERFRDGRPVAARPDSFAYRASRFVARHRLGLGLLGAAVLLLALVVGLYSLRLARERAQTERAAAEALEASSFLRGLFAVASPSDQAGERWTARERLDRGVERVRRELAGKPHTEAAMLLLVGGVYRDLAHLPEAGAALERALELRRRTPGTPRTELAAALFELGRLRVVEARLEEAEPLFNEALRLWREAHGGKDARVGRGLAGLGDLARARGQYQDAIRQLEEALTIQESALGGDHPDLSFTLRRLALCHRELADSTAALAAARRMLSILERSREDDHPELAEAHGLMADLLTFQGDLEAARREHEKAIPLLEHAYGGNHPLLARGLAEWGSFLEAQGERQAAMAQHRRALEIRRAVFGEAHPETAESMQALGFTARRMGDFVNARRWLSAAVPALEKALGPEHPRVAVALKSLGDALAWGGAPDEALPVFERALAIRQKQLEPGHPLLAEPLFKVGRLRLELGRPQDAEAPLRQALAIYSRMDVGGDHALIMPRLALSHCLAKLGQTTEAESLLSLCTAALEDPEPELSRRFLAARLELEVSQGKPREAAATHRALEALKKKP